MAKLKGELQADGDILHPHTSADVTFMQDGTTVEQRLAKIKLYFSLTDVNASYTPATSLRTVLTAMANNSELHCNITATSVDYPETGILHIIKTATNTASMTLDSATKRRIANVTPQNIEQIFGGGIIWKLMINNDDFQTLETEIAETKKSVSDGKTLVAAAITRKDVTTAATDTFVKMASNIDSITTVEQGTADATAVASDILLNKTAYKNGLKLIGSMANNGAVASAIANGVLKQGYTSGGAIANLVAGNIKQGVNIGGVVGTFEEVKFYDSGVVLCTKTNGFRFSFGFNADIVLVNAGSYAFNTPNVTEPASNRYNCNAYLPYYGCMLSGNTGTCPSPQLDSNRSSGYLHWYWSGDAGDVLYQKVRVYALKINSTP